METSAVIFHVTEDHKTLLEVDEPSVLKVTEDPFNVIQKGRGCDNYQPIP